MTGQQLTCTALVEVITDYLEGGLNAEAAAAVEAHLAVCPGCGAYLDQMRATLGALGHVPVQTLSERAQADLLAAFRDFHRPSAAKDAGAGAAVGDDADVGAPAVLTRVAASHAVGHLGWRYLLGAIQTAVPVASIAQAAEVAARVTAAAGPEADDCLGLDLRAERVTVTLTSLTAAGVTVRETALAERISATVRQLGLVTSPTSSPKAGPTNEGALAPRSLQVLELAIDTMDVAAIRPFWMAVLGYVAETGPNGPMDALVDPLRQGPALWFQQLAEPRPQRNRIHLDLCVPHDEALHRLEAALAAGGVLVSDQRAPAFWILADADGNEVCITTWQGRDG